MSILSRLFKNKNKAVSQSYNDVQLIPIPTDINTRYIQVGMFASLFLNAHKDTLTAKTKNIWTPSFVSGIGWDIKNKKSECFVPKNEDEFSVAQTYIPVSFLARHLDKSRTVATSTALNGKSSTQKPMSATQRVQTANMFYNQMIETILENRHHLISADDLAKKTDIQHYSPENKDFYYDLSTAESDNLFGFVLRKTKLEKTPKIVSGIKELPSHDL